MNTSHNIALCKEQWILHSGIPADVLFGSTVGLNEDFLTNPPEPENLEKVIRIFEQRERIKQHSLVTAAIGEEDFLPISSLARGAKQGAAVCRIARYFSRKSFQEFIEEIRKAIAKWGTTERFNTVAKLKEIFLIPDSVAQEIFSLHNPAENNTLLNANDLFNMLKNLTDNQLAKINPIPIGTGFLVGGTHLLTNQHVLPSVKFAEECVAQFHYEDNEDSPQASIDYEFDPQTLFVSEPSLDYTLVQLKSGVFTRQAGYRMGWIQLIEDDAAICPGLLYLQFESGDPDTLRAKLASNNVATTSFSTLLPFQNKDLWSDLFFPKQVLFINVQKEEQLQDVKNFPDSKDYTLEGKNSGDSVSIIQHPKGRRKEISTNKVIDYGLFKNFLRYEANTDYGSSGSPVFNERWQLVALNHAAIPSKNQPAKIDAHQGIRICRIIEDLRRKSFTNSKLESFIQDFVITAEQLNYPPLPTASRLNGSSNQKNGYFNCGYHESLNVSEAITCEAWVVKLDDENGVIFHHHEGEDPGFGYWMWWFKGKIRVQLQSAPKQSIVDTKEVVLRDRLFHHVAFTWSKSQKTNIYIDGELQETKVNWDNPLESPLGIPKTPVFIGRGCGREYSFPDFSGIIAEVRLWRTVRTQDQIRETMYRRLIGDYSKDGLIGYWQFEEDRASKTYVYNLAAPDGGSKVPSIPLFTPPSKIQPQFGLELNGQTDYINCGSFEIKTAITFEAWVRVEQNQRQQESLIADQGGTFEGKGFSLWWWEGFIYVELKGDNGELSFSSRQVMPDDNDHDWHHIAFTWSSAIPNPCIYIDGNRFQDQTSFAGPIGLSSLNFCLGRTKALTFYYFNGSIAEVRLWSVARSEEQIKAAMNQMLTEQDINDSNLLGYWPLNEQAGNEASNLANKDLVGKQPGLVTGGIWLKPQYASQYSDGDYGVPLGDVKWLKASECPASLPLPCGLKFNDKKDAQVNCVNCGHDPSLNVTDAITVEAWVKHWFGNCLIVSRGCYVHDGYSLCWQDGKIRVMFQDQTTNQKVSVDTKENAPVDRVWHHIAFTWDKTSKEIFIYVDGRQQDCVVIEGQAKSFAYNEQTKSTALFTGSLADLKTDFVIGGNTEEGQYYDVAIAEVRLWKVVRTQDQIKTSMTCRLSRRDSDWQDLLGYWRLDDGGTQARNLVSDSNHGVIQGAQWYPAPPSSASLSQPPTPTQNPSTPTPSA